MKCHITSMFSRLFKKDESLRICKSHRAYEYFKKEYAHEIFFDGKGNIIMRNERERLEKTKERICRYIKYGTEAYQYYLNEYRENSPLRDASGNIILSDDIARLK